MSNCKANQEFLDKVLKDKYEVDKNASELMIRVGKYVLKVKDIIYMAIEPLDKDDPNNADFINDGNDTQLILFTKHGTYLSLLKDQKSIIEICDILIDKINDLILTKKV